MRKVIKLVQVGAVVYKETGFLAVMLHKVVSGNFKGFLYALTNSNTRDNNDKFAPAVLLIQLEHRLDIHIGFTCTCFHFNIKAASADILHQSIGKLYIIFRLDFINIAQ